MSLEIRRAVPGDARAVAEVHVASWRWAYRELIADAALQALSVEAREAMCRDVIPLGGVVVAVEGDQIVGFVAFGAPDQPASTDRAGEIFAIYVLEGWAGIGVGRTLIARATEGLRERGFQRATLWVLEDNVRARRFYEAAGWRSDGENGVCDIDGAGYDEVRYAIKI